MCRKECSTTSCPFAFTDESETIQNYGCLPTSMQIIAMRVLQGKTWACHSDNTKPCLGGLKYLNKFGYDNSIIDPVLITEENFTRELGNFTDADLNAFNESRMKKYMTDNNLSIKEID